VATSAILTVGHGGHKDTSTASFLWAFSSQTLNLSVGIDLIVLEHSELDLLALVLDFLRGGVNLLLALLAATTKTQNQVEGRLFLDIVIGESAAVLKLLASENETLLVWWNAFLVLNFCLYIVDGVRRLHLKGDCFTRKGFYEDLHLSSCLRI